MFEVQNIADIDGNDRDELLGAIYQKAMVRTVGVGRGSGIEVQEHNAHVTWIRGGTPYRMKVFTERERALAAAGVRE